MAISQLILSASSMVNALGHGTNATLDALQSNQSGLQYIENLQFSTWVGKVAGLGEVSLEAELDRYACRNNKLARLALDTDDFRAAIEKAKHTYGAHRIGVFLGTSTSGSAETEKAYCNRNSQNQLPEDYDFMHSHNMGSLVHYTMRSLGLSGVGQVISTACSSSAKVFTAAHRHIEAGFCDAAIVGGIDTLTMTSLYGFHSLELVSSDPCRPWDDSRNGINIGEAAGFTLLEPSTSSNKGVVLKGYGESSDAYHMSTPHPEGLGAASAMDQALGSAGLSPAEIDYINLHGTATPSNDAAEDQAVNKVFGNTTPCSSTKGWTGHTLGAAGITEALICKLVLEQQFMPANLNMQNKDNNLNSNIISTNRPHTLRNVMTNSFGFGGTNCSLILGLHDA